MTVDTPRDHIVPHTRAAAHVAWALANGHSSIAVHTRDTTPDDAQYLATVAAVAGAAGLKVIDVDTPRKLE